MLLHFHQSHHLKVFIDKPLLKHTLPHSKREIQEQFEICKHFKCIVNLGGEKMQNCFHGPKTELLFLNTSTRIT